MAELYGNDSNRESKKIRNQYKNKVQIYEGRMKTGKILMATGILCTVGILIIISFGNMDFNTVVLGIILFILCVAMIIGMILMDESEPKYKKSKEELESLGVDVQGEDVIASTLKSLPNDYMIFNNVALNYNGELTEIDSIILSCHGIFVVDVKNYKGVLFGLESDDVWSRTKTSKADKSYDGAIKNPVKQVDRKAQIVSNVLYKKGIRTDVEGYVVLPMADKVIVDSDKVFLNIIQLKQMILSKNQAILSQDKVETIKDILMQL